MSRPLRVRAYNVRFGDAFLVTVPDRDEAGDEVTRHVLFDVGNVLSGEGGDDAVFEPVIEDIVTELGGAPLDLYVMTHEHLDHVQGLLYASDKLGVDLSVRHSWLTASAADDYYDRFPDAKRKADLAKQFYDAIERRLRAKGALDARTDALLANNNPSRTADCIRHLRNLADHTHYVFRGLDVTGMHPFVDARFEIWAPEEDTSDYYGRFQPLAFGAMGGAAHDGTSRGHASRGDAGVALEPPRGVDVGAFFDLVRSRQSDRDNLLAIDKAKNNTSVVLMLEWHGWRLLFAGDAELRSWRTMRREKVLSPVHFLKVSHHGSHNGTPSPEILDLVLPPDSPDERERHAVVSTCLHTYDGVPHTETLDVLAERCEITSTEGLAVGDYVDIEFEP